MDLTDLSLAPRKSCIAYKSTNSSLSESEKNHSKKRKHFSDNWLKSTNGATFQTSLDLQLKDPLPLDWEQCLDLESGRMYYLNRKTLRKSWNYPKDQKPDLELNMSTNIPNSSAHQYCSSSNSSIEDQSNKLQYSSSGSSNMVALACLNCHLLVILSKSSPSCPNCKYVHSLPTLQAQPLKVPAVKSLNTLSLLN